MRTELAFGRPWETIIRRAHTSGAEMVVIGGHNRRKFGAIFLSSTASRLLRRGNLPVLNANAVATSLYRRPEIAVDLEKTSVKVLETPLWVLQSEVPYAAVLHAYEVLFEGFGFPALSAKELADYREDARTNARSSLLNLLGAFDGARCVLQPILRRGDPRRVIPREGASRKADLLVLGTHGRAALSRSMLGSVAEWIVRAARRDVLMARPSR